MVGCFVGKPPLRESFVDLENRFRGIGVASSTANLTIALEISGGRSSKLAFLCWFSLLAQYAQSLYIIVVTYIALETWYSNVLAGHGRSMSSPGIRSKSVC